MPVNAAKLTSVVEEYLGDLRRLRTSEQVLKGKPRAGQTPERGVVEVKAPSDDALLSEAMDGDSKFAPAVTGNTDFAICLV